MRGAQLAIGNYELAIATPNWNSSRLKAQGNLRISLGSALLFAWEKFAFVFQRMSYC